MNSNRDYNRQSMEITRAAHYENDQRMMKVVSRILIFTLRFVRSFF